MTLDLVGWMKVRLPQHATLVTASSGGVQGTHAPINLQVRTSMSYYIKLFQILHTTLGGKISNCYSPKNYSFL